MRYWLSHIATPADQLGFEGIMGPDHLVWWGGEIASRYPHNESGQVWWPEDRSATKVSSTGRTLRASLRDAHLRAQA